MSVEAVLFDWGGTLTPRHTRDLRDREIAWTKPHPEAFDAVRTAVGVTDPEACIFGDVLGVVEARG